MIKTTDFEIIYNWLKDNCKAFEDLQVISSRLEGGKSVIQLNSSENMYDVSSSDYTDGKTKYVFSPRKPYFFDVDVICFRDYYDGGNTINLDTNAKLQEICDWVIECQNKGITPPIDSCYQIECISSKPFIRGEYQDQSDFNRFLIDVAVTIRFYTDNPAIYKVVVR